MITGKRAVVYLASKDQPGVFEGRIIELGARAGDQYIVKSGLEEGDLVVSHGAFKIDSAVQILAKPSMMNPAEGQETGFETPIEFREQLGAVVTNYFGMSDALSHDDFEKAKTAANQLENNLSAVDMALLTGKAHIAWMKNLAGIKKSVDEFKLTADIQSARDAFDPLSTEIIAAVESFGLTGESSVFVIHCPMASDMKGADWLQPMQTIENPYMGSKMFTCGAQTREMKARGATNVRRTETPVGTGADQHNH